MTTKKPAQSAKALSDNGRCFVMQPFDNGPFDRRFEEVLTPAIQQAGLAPYRVDKDPRSSIPIEDIEDIEEGIKSSRSCVADISTQNPNVAYELGFAIAMRKPVVLIGKTGTTLPFNFRHRKVLFYDTESPKAFEAFGASVTEAVLSLLQRTEQTERIAEVLEPTEGLESHEVSALAGIAQIIESPDDWAPMSGIRNVMDEMGFNRMAATLALAELLRLGLVRKEESSDHNGEPFTIYYLQPAGVSWLLNNKTKLKLSVTEEDRARKRSDTNF